MKVGKRKVGKCYVKEEVRHDEDEKGEKEEERHFQRL